ncbi:hypothetical protein LZ30DRAFT_603873, partial [Colletotrichum cereale]
GHEAAEELAAFQMSNVDAIKQYIAIEKVDCDFIATRAIDVKLTNDDCRKVDSGFKSWKQLDS